LPPRQGPSGRPCPERDPPWNVLPRQGLAETRRGRGRDGNTTLGVSPPLLVSVSRISDGPARFQKPSPRRSVGNMAQRAPKQEQSTRVARWKAWLPAAPGQCPQIFFAPRLLGPPGARCTPRGSGRRGSVGAVFDHAGFERVPMGSRQRFESRVGKPGSSCRRTGCCLPSTTGSS
jgi:hypothetical protein